MMKEKELISLEQNFSETINKIKCLRDIEPNPNWVLSDRSRLAFKMEMKRKKGLLAKDVFQLKELLSFWNNWQPHKGFRPAYTFLTILGIIFGRDRKSVV